jgi:hypothetical protein
MCAVSATVPTWRQTPFTRPVVGVRRLNQDSWIERIGPATVLDVDVREPGTKHAISLQQVERWLTGATTNPNEASTKAKLKMMLVQSSAPPAAAPR